MISKLIELLSKRSEPVLGRWKLKTCDDIKSAVNSIYQNRDHCGDIICKTPKKAEDYIYNNDISRKNSKRPDTIGFVNNTKKREEKMAAKLDTTGTPEN